MFRKGNAESYVILGSLAAASILGLSLYARHRCRPPHRLAIQNMTPLPSTADFEHALGLSTGEIVSVRQSIDFIRLEFKPSTPHSVVSDLETKWNDNRPYRPYWERIIDDHGKHTEDGQYRVNLVVGMTDSQNFKAFEKFPPKLEYTHPKFVEILSEQKLQDHIASLTLHGRTTLELDTSKTLDHLNDVQLQLRGKFKGIEAWPLLGTSDIRPGKTSRRRHLVQIPATLELNKWVADLNKSQESKEEKKFSP